MKRRIAISLLFAAIIIPFAVNAIGWNFFIYINFGKKDLILAASRGVSHNAWAEHLEAEPDFGSEFTTDFEDQFTTTIIDTGFLNVFLERRGDPMTPLMFRRFEPDEYMDYRGFEFPWLLWLLLPSVILVISSSRTKRNAENERGTENADAM